MITISEKDYALKIYLALNVSMYDNGRVSSVKIRIKDASRKIAISSIRTLEHRYTSTKISQL